MANTTEEYIRVKGSFLEIRQKIGKGTVSGSGRNMTVVSTGGFQGIEGSDIRVNLTAIKKR